MTHDTEALKANAGARKIPAGRLAVLEAAASPGGFDWQTGNRSHGAACNWLFRKKLVAWGHVDRKQVVVATPSGRAALAQGGHHEA